MKVCVFNAKGGVGRTTLTLNLAGHFAQAHPGHRILVQDRDPQGSALAWAALADVTPFTVGRSRSWGFDIELFDMPPSLPEISTLPTADLYVVPTTLDGVAFVAFLRSVQILRAQALPILVVANRVNPNRAEHRDRLASADMCGAVVVRERSAMAGCYAQGRTVFGMRGRHIADAQRDVAALGHAIQASISEPKRAS